MDSAYFMKSLLIMLWNIVYTAMTFAVPFYNFLNYITQTCLCKYGYGFILSAAILNCMLFTVALLTVPLVANTE